MHPVMIAGIAGSAIGVLGGLVGTYYSIRSTNGPREQAFMIKSSIYGWAGIAVFLVLLFLVPHPYRWFLCVPYGVALPVAIIRCNRTQARIRAEESAGGQPRT